MGCFNSKPEDNGAALAAAASNPLVKGATKYGTTGAGAGAGAGGAVPPGPASRTISTGGVDVVPGRVVWIGHSAGSDRRHIGYDMLYRVLSIYAGAGSGLVVGDLVSSDPYARVRYQDKLLATDVKKTTLNPEWGQWLHFVGIESGGPWGNYLLHVLDHDNVGSDESLGGVLVDITDADRKLRPKARWLPLENTPSGQVHIITMAHKFGLMTLTLRKVTIMAETLGTTPSLSVNILHMNRTIEYSEQPVRSESAADWNETQSFWASVDKDAPCILQVVSKLPSGQSHVVASCQFLAREYVNVKGSLVSIPLHRGAAGAFGAELAQLEVAIGQVVVEIAVHGGGDRGLASEQHVPSLVAAVHHSAAALSGAITASAPPSTSMYYPIWQHPNASTDESKVTEYEELLELVREHPVCCDCGSEDPPSTWIVTATDNSFSCIVCPRCVGVHRGVGADRVVPKSAVLDDEYWTAEHVNAAKEGRAHADTAGLLEPCCDAATARPERERLIREKYGFDPVDTAGRADANKNTFTHVVTVTVVECKDLINGDTMSLSDPYVIVQLGASGAETPQVWRTSVKSNTLNPVYNEKSETFKWDGVQPMEIRVMDSDVLFDDPLGHAVVCLEGIPSSAEFEQTVTVPLQGVKSGVVTLRILHYDYSEMQGTNLAARYLKVGDHK